MKKFVLILLLLLGSCGREELLPPETIPKVAVPTPSGPAASPSPTPVESVCPGKSEKKGCHVR